MSAADNLNITEYSLTEILQLYGLPANPSVEQMATAKKQMLRMHPDISRLPPDYFGFYKQAYEICFSYYKTNNRQLQQVTAENAVYHDIATDNEQQQSAIKEQLQKKPKKEFQKNFNELFEKNGGINREKMEKQKSRNEWFSSQDPAIPDNNLKGSVKQMGSNFDYLRDTGHSVVAYQKKAEPMMMTMAAGYYHDDIEEEAEQQYIASDVFNAKLKYDDIRRVHKDQTILPVSESGYNAKKQDSLEQRQQLRQQSIQPAATTDKHFEDEAEKIRIEWSKKWEKSEARIRESEKQNQSVLSAFMRLMN